MNQMFGASAYQTPFPAYPQTYPQSRLNGREVASIAEVGVGDVATDGSMSWFPARDGSCVWGKRWNPNGTIQTVQYTPEPVEAPQDEMAGLIRRVEALEARLSGKEAVVESD